MIMSIEEHDQDTGYCRMLGHHVPFSYCRTGAGSQPCRKILDCWFETFDVRTFVNEHYSQEQIQAILTPAKPKMLSLLELIEQARRNAAPEGENK